MVSDQATQCMDHADRHGNYKQKAPVLSTPQPVDHMNSSFIDIVHQRSTRPPVGPDVQKPACRSQIYYQYLFRRPLSCRMVIDFPANLTTVTAHPLRGYGHGALDRSKPKAPVVQPLEPGAAPGQGEADIARWTMTRTPCDKRGSPRFRYVSLPRRECQPTHTLDQTGTSHGALYFGDALHDKQKPWRRLVAHQTYTLNIVKRKRLVEDRNGLHVVGQHITCHMQKAEDGLQLLQKPITFYWHP